MILLQTGKSVKWTSQGEKVKVYLPKSILKNKEAVAFSFTK